MPDLIAQGLGNRRRRRLPDNQPVVLGRDCGLWSIPWDGQISRCHLEMTWRDGRLHVEVAAAARNPVFVRGKAMHRFSIVPGEHFVIGQTTFTLVEQQAGVSLDLPMPAAEQSFSREYLREIRYRNADQRMEVLGRLPEILEGADSEDELLVRLVGLLLAGVGRADAAAVVSVEEPAIRILYWDTRDARPESGFQPSERLIRRAVERREGIVHVWREPAGQRGPFTQRENVDWAFCLPLADARRPWCIYLAGQATDESGSRVSDPADLREELKFTELVASMLGQLCRLRDLQTRHAGLRRFLSPKVLESLAEQDPETALTPRQIDATVLFCDLRGFSRSSESGADDLLGLLHRVGSALGVMTRHILDQGGVVGDFHGDAAMGFWGWPLPQPDAAFRACRAALAIEREFRGLTGPDAEPLPEDFQIGIGIASGRAVAGRIGTVDQVKVTAFGPVVNLASRLEGMTKPLRAPLLLDRATALAMREQVGPDQARVRRLATVRPYGLQTPVEVYQLLPPVSDDPLLTDEHLALSDRAVDLFQRGEWSEAFHLLRRLPAEDRAIDFLTVYIARANRTPPPGWDGVIPLAEK